MHFNVNEINPLQYHAILGYCKTAHQTIDSRRYKNKPNQSKQNKTKTVTSNFAAWTVAAEGPVLGYQQVCRWLCLSPVYIQDWSP